MTPEQRQALSDRMKARMAKLTPEERKAQSDKMKAARAAKRAAAGSTVVVEKTKTRATPKPKAEASAAPAARVPFVQFDKDEDDYL